MGDFTSDYLAFRRQAGAVWLRRDFVRVSGPDTRDFLHGQLSQNVDVEPGTSGWSLLLQPQGKVVALLRFVRMAADEYVLDTDAGSGEAVIERLNRFKLRVKCTVEPLQWSCLAVRGPGAHEMAAGAADGTALVADWPGLPGVDLAGESVEPPASVRVCELDAYEAVRVEAGIPVMGRELDEGVIPAEAGVVEMTVSFTKGCYTGQELVARIDSRGGNVPRRLRGIVIGTNVLPPPGASITANGKDVGRVTSVAESLDRRAPVALAYVGRAVEPPADVTVSWEGGSVPATVEALPLVK